MTTELTVTPGQRPDGTALLAVAGEIDMSNADAFAEALDGTRGRLVVDLTAVGYLDSAGLSVLFAHADRIEVIAAPSVAPVLAVSGLAELTAVHESGPGHDTGAGSPPVTP
ncbi:STAS domain-containing protein [Streptomyces sp. 549]|uniref:STAS domain-containing protein n=1 Tax=Streptomyces sp. 549 TaxID=3049076 RepID=UPI0024C46702|nr:STAS domain-containing protein [Streptomyces sp. 549]MDK1471926.1 STAS domain-containing protein [Streptomyces sp. 549]